MVVVAQLAERLVVVQEVAGSTPVDHPRWKGSLWLSVTTLSLYLHISFYDERGPRAIASGLPSGFAPGRYPVSAAESFAPHTAKDDSVAIRPIVIHGNPVLHRPAAPVTEFNDELKELVADMYETMDASNGVGLAAPQIGVGLRIFTYKMENEDGVPPRGCIINPVLTLGKISTADPDPYEEEEGCLSFPGYGFPLKRAEWVTVNGLDEHGNPVHFEATGWFARCMQHETDHLDGKLYVNRLNKKWTGKMKKVVKKEGWTVDGNSWMPGVDPDPFGH